MPCRVSWAASAAVLTDLILQLATGPGVGRRECDDLINPVGKEMNRDVGLAILGEGRDPRLERTAVMKSRPRMD